MKTHDLLVAAQAECLRLFGQLLSDVPKRCADRLFAMAEQSKDSREQRLLLDAYGVLIKRQSELRKKLESNLGTLIDRGIRTAYNLERPTVASAISADALFLIDTSIIEDELKLGKLTGLFHTKSGASIKELTLRIASLFNHDMVSERENPFRPYLFSRTVFVTVDDIGLAPEAARAASQELINVLLDGVDGIYRSLNAFFEMNGVASKLPNTVNPVKNPISRFAKDIFRSTVRAEDREPAGMHNDKASNTDVPLKQNAREPRSPLRKVEQLLRMVRKNARPVRDASTHASSRSQTFPGEPGYVDARPATHDADPSSFRERASSTVAAEPSAWSPPSTVLASGKYSVFKKDISVAAETATQSSNAVSKDLSDGWALEKKVVADTLKQFMTAGTHGSAASSGVLSSISLLDAQKSLPENSIFHVLKENNGNHLNDVLHEDGEVRNLILESRDALINKANGPSEAMTIDIVGMILEFILRDVQVPSPVRAQLGRLQLLLLKIALLDRQLLTHQSHPARQLMNRIGTISQSLAQSGQLSDRVTAEIQRIVEALLTHEGHQNHETMRDLMRQFETFIETELRTSDPNIERLAEAIEKAEQRSTALLQMKAGLKKSFASIKVDPYLQHMIEDWWLLAIGRIQQANPQQAERYRYLVPELVWSVLDKRTERDRSQLLSLLPNLLADLKNGMNAVNCTEKSDFLSWLIDNHTRAIKATGIRSELLSLESIQKRFAPFTNPDASSADSSFAVVTTEKDEIEFHQRMIDDAVNEMQAKVHIVNEVLEPDVGGGRQLADEPASQAPLSEQLSDVDIGSDMQGVLGQLMVGVPIKINLDGSACHATLHWISLQARYIILSLEARNVPTMINVRLFRRLLSNGRVRFLEVAPLFERAVNALLETADQVDGILE